MLVFDTKEQVDHLVQLFEACALPKERWTHEAHLAVARCSYSITLPKQLHH